MRCVLSLFFHMHNLEACLSAPFVHGDNVLFYFMEHGMHAHMLILEACVSAPFIKTCGWQNHGGCLLCKGRHQPDSYVCASTYSFCPTSADYSCCCRLALCSIAVCFCSALYVAVCSYSARLLQDADALILLLILLLSRHDGWVCT